MQTDLPDNLLVTDRGQRANEILRSCVHCGFCNATCPTYQLSGDELDGPRGRIYLIKDVLEGQGDVQRMTTHLDRCLTCRACETTCPSGVAYGELAEIARNDLGPARGGLAGVLRRALQWLVPNPIRMRFLMRLGLLARPLVPQALRRHMPDQLGNALPVSKVAVSSNSATDPVARERTVVLLQGCAQQVMTGGVNEHLLALLAARGINAIAAAKEGCCGSLDLHLGDEARALARVRHNVDVLHPYLEQASALLSSASGCGVTVKDYGRLLANDPNYARRAEEVSAHALDVSEYLAQVLDRPQRALTQTKIAWHAPCSLTHGQQISGLVENLLGQAGYVLVPVADQHLCCGSAGTYSILQPERSGRLKEAKLAALLVGEPEVIASANVGCQMQLGNASPIPVRHWIELLK